MQISKKEIATTPQEQRRQVYEAESVVTWNGSVITVDEANKVYLQHSAEGNQKAQEIQTLIVAAKELIRQMYPDEDA